MEVLNVDNGTDYRRRALEHVKLYHCPLDDTADADLEQAFNRLAEAHDEEPVLHIESRDIRAVRKECAPDASSPVFHLSNSISKDRCRTSFHARCPGSTKCSLRNTLHLNTERSIPALREVRGARPTRRQCRSRFRSPQS
jgi:hypothetical protein